MSVVGLIAGILGGWVCAIIARTKRGANALAIVVLALGLLMAIPAFLAEPVTEPRGSDVSSMDAMMKAQTPPWITVVNPIIGAIGVLIGASLRRPPAAPRA
jgi:hypothetical protein